MRRSCRFVTIVGLALVSCAGTAEHSTGPPSVASSAAATVPSTSSVAGSTLARSTAPLPPTTSTGRVGSTSPAVASSVANSEDGRPNVLFVLTDDMRFDDMQYLPHVQQLVGDLGVTFDDQFDNVTLCCPARTSILRGQYSHNTGVLTNAAANGGFETAHRTNIEQSTIATTMHAAGYATGLFGKYLNGYPDTVGPSYVPPGWDTWSSSTKGNAYGEYNYTLNQSGTQVAYGHTPKDYGTDVYFGQATDFIDQAANDGKPYFVYLAVYAPHQPATPAVQDLQTFPGLGAPRDPSFNEADVSDKPSFVRGRPLLGARLTAAIDALARRRAQSLQAVDRDLAALIDHLRQHGMLDNTYIVFTSDNGFHLGQHRLPAGKQTAFETDIHLPLMIRGPGVTAGAHVNAITGNVDLAPTIATLGGTAMTDNPDGRSLAPFLTAKPSESGAIIRAPTGWRNSYLLEHWTATSVSPTPSGAGQLEPDDPDQGGTTPAGDGTTDTVPAATPTAPKANNAVIIPEFQGLRVDGYMYVEYSTGERELYNLTVDPDELTNIAGKAAPALLAVLHQRLDELRTCAADTCRALDSKPLNLPK
jgi:N-acetylglucosamine-6-sulfatase